MRLPIKAPARAILTGPETKAPAAATTQATRDGVTQAGCCAQVCAPLVGCHCVAESPFC